MQRDFQKQAELTAAKVNNWIDKTLLSLHQNSVTSSIISMDPKVQVPILEASAKLVQLVPSSFRFFTIDLDGNVIARSDGKKLQNYRDRIYFRNILEGKELGQQVVVGRTSGRPALCLSVPIKNVEQLVGVLAGCADLIDISNSIAEIQIGETGFAFLVDSDKNVIIHGKPQRIFIEKSPNFSNHPIFQGSRDGDQFFSIYQDQGREIMGFKQPINLGWTLVIQQDTEEAFALINQTKKRTNLLVSITLFLTTLIAYFFIRVSLNESILKSKILKQTADLIDINQQLEIEIAEGQKRSAELSQEKERSEQLLLNILPSEIAEKLKKSESPAEHFESVTILFADIVNFTNLSTRMTPLELVAGLNEIFSVFDQMTEKYALEKIKTIGDAYMVVGGLPSPRADHAEAIADMALEMQAYMKTVPNSLGENLQLRIGINTGEVIAGVIGIKKFIYDLWGDAVNIVSRMEDHGQPGQIQVTDSTYNYLKDRYILKERGTLNVRGRGEMKTYWLIGKKFHASPTLIRRPHLV